ncbi:MAG: flagellar biosynthetic protein FliR [Gammaproteobacteria bacterium]|nr:MAG: flagellar biosynthetic protein FliR [Gammaproteobacteria bacterium]
MLQITFSQMETWLALFIWPFTRITALLAAAPLLSHSSIPVRAKIGLAFLLTLLVSPLLPPLPDTPVLSWGSVGILVEQVLIGLAIGMAMSVVFSAVQAAGDMIGLQMGLAFASFFSPDTGANTMILARLLYMIALLLFLAVDGHLLLINILVGSFSLIPIAAFSLNPGGFMVLVNYAGIIFSAGLLLALPVLGVLLIINLAMGILNRAAPQFTVFSVGFPISLTVGILLFALLMQDLGGALMNLFDQGLIFTQQLLSDGLKP